MKSNLIKCASALAVLSCLAPACSNSDSSSTTTAAAVTTTGVPTPDTGGSEPSTTAAPSNRDVFKPITGVPGVSDKEIGYAVIGTRSNNPLGTCILDCYLDGIKAYFAFRNSEGGIYGRQLVVNQEIDDELANNQARALDIVSNNKSFGSFNATLLSSGWGDLDSAGIPTYTWGIQPADSANRLHIFPSIATMCSGGCTSHLMPYAAKSAGAKHVAALGYGVTENSKTCVAGYKNSVTKFPEGGADIAYFNDNLAFGLPNGIGPEVTAMKAANVDFIATCMDLNAMKTLAQELHRQGMDNVTLYHPNTYNQKFVTDADPLFEGDFVSVGFLPFEADTAGTTLGEFLTWMEKAGKTPSELAMVGWINASIAFEGLLAAGPEFDRTKVTDATNALTADTAGGLLKPINWSTDHAPYTESTRPADKQGECVTLVRVTKGKFVTVAPPATPWMCWASGEWSDPEFKAFK
ncbi:MAG: ABC transporter substrate-binding protein [Actinobacteria bacterium]|uniref:Unannotated protein n=1 Tax=freshwater metagenome TaxID=449393 RepID=A0A6J7NX83_9ZZZZ|nr:ABC transporter substrate-binding protein [Actinomycetota bacterium]MSW78752.1 ABC transporter substrate-binding protein [Actinomycetota bacterium]MSX56299.1 ABC transporter substrate-binding protein [Actinomycetota bacterium]MSZ84788.1 ABC transporter substrate-binding protein [Actinomycetota bacterium]MTB19507.1 ABC transporter substrate-binding protein [Actinomycetota bacterium]